MIKLMIVGRRAPGRSRRAAHGHLRDVHGPLVVAPPADAGAMPTGYVQNHVFDGVYPAAAGGSRHALERDLVTELWFDSPEHMRASVQTPYYLANLKPDEPRFVDDPVVERLLVREEEAKPGRRGAYKLFVFASRDDVDDDRWREASQAAITSLQAADAIVANIGLPGPFGPPLADVVIEAWYPDRDAAAAALDAGPLTAFGAAADSKRSFAVVAEAFDSERLRQLIAG